MLLRFVDTLIKHDGNRKAVDKLRGLRQGERLLLTGKTGLGKTQLLNVYKNDYINHHPNARCKWIDPESFRQDLVKHLQKNRLHKFRKKYSHLNCLIIDDFQEVAGKDRTGYELDILIKDSIANRATIILASDAKPKKSLGYNCRLLYRVSGFKRIKVKKIGVDAYSEAITRSKKCMDVEEKLMSARPSDFYKLQNICNEKDC